MLSTVSSSVNGGDDDGVILMRFPVVKVLTLRLWACHEGLSPHVLRVALTNAWQLSYVKSSVPWTHAPVSRAQEPLTAGGCCAGQWDSGTGLSSQRPRQTALACVGRTALNTCHLSHVLWGSWVRAS